jgi:hypothetical protein
MTTPWPGYTGAVSLTFDDGTQSQIDEALPRLNDRGLRGTFYVVAGNPLLDEREEVWQDAARRGHEIGNHTYRHHGPANITGGKGLEDMSLADIERDIDAARARLARLAPNQPDWSFCYPCNCPWVGRGAGRESYVPVVAERFLAARSAGEYGFANDPRIVDLYNVWGLCVERMSGFEMIGLVEELTARDLWVVLAFHEINGVRLSVMSEDFEMLLDYLVRKQGQIWTAPLVEVARRVHDYQRSNEPS